MFFQKKAACEFLANKHISFVKTLKMRGPSIEHFGTLDVTVVTKFPTLHLCFLFVR